MTITQLQYIVAVDNYRHFAKAAKACFVTQPTLSMQIHKLEEELDALIFDRSKQPIKPTQLGEKILEQARVVIAESEKIDQITKDAKGSFDGDFRIGIIPTIAPYLLHRFLKRFQEKLPEVNLIIEELQTHQILDRLRKDTLDAGILATPLEEKGIIETPLFYEPFVAYVPEEHRLHDEQFILNSELDIDDILLLNEGHCFRASVLNLCEQTPHKEERNFSLESGNFETLIRLSEQGFGMTLLPYLSAADLPKGLQKNVKPLAEPKPTREVSVIYSRRQLKISLINLLSDVIQKSVPKNMLLKQEPVLAPK